MASKTPGILDEAATHLSSSTPDSIISHSALLRFDTQT